MDISVTEWLIKFVKEGVKKKLGAKIKENINLII